MALQKKLFESPATLCLPQTAQEVQLLGFFCGPRLSAAGADAEVSQDTFRRAVNSASVQQKGAARGGRIADPEGVLAVAGMLQRMNWTCVQF